MQQSRNFRSRSPEGAAKQPAEKQNEINNEWAKEWAEQISELHGPEGNWETQIGNPAEWPLNGFANERSVFGNSDEMREFYEWSARPDSDVAELPEAFSASFAYLGSGEVQRREFTSIESNVQAQVGITKMVVAAPGVGMGSDEMEKLLGFENGKIKHGLMINKMVLPGLSESNVTFVADALYSMVKGITDDSHAMDRLADAPIRSIYFATESNADRSRPEIEPSLMIVASKLIEEDEAKYRPIIDMLKNASVVPITFACVGGVLAMNEAVNRVRGSLSSDEPESALVITADTAVYDGKKAKNAEATQGAAAVAMWVSGNPELVSVMPKPGVGSFHETLSDFTKFGSETPVVYGTFSELAYIYVVSKALDQLEEHYSKSNGEFDLGGFGFFISHVPFPKQAIYFTSYLFARYLEDYEPKHLDEMQDRESLGKSPMGGKSLTDLIEERLKDFNRGGGKEEWEIVDWIEKDKGISDAWSWIKKLGKQPEFKEFIGRFHINEALALPSEIGNSYSSSAFVSLASALTRYDFSSEPESRKGIFVGYGSGAQSMAYTIDIIATPESVGRNIAIKTGNQNRITAEQYKVLHEELIKGDAERLISDASGGNPIEKDMEILHTEKLSEGFHVLLRKPDGTGRYAYVDGDGKVKALTIRH